MNEFLSKTLFDNTVANILWCVGILLFGLLLKRFFSVFLSKNLYRLVGQQHVPIAEFVQLVRKPIEYFFLLIITYLAFDRLHLPTTWSFVPATQFGFRMVIFKSYEALLICTFAWLLIRVVLFVALVFKHNAEAQDSRLHEQFIPFFKDLGIMSVVLLTIFVLLGRVFEVNVPALITGLGIGGLAIALAARETLENLFASFGIMLDMPFALGDTVQVGTVLGNVEKMGFRNTHIRLKDGGLAILPNRLIASQTIENQTQRPFWRAMYMLNLHDETPLEKIQQVVTDITQLIENHPHIYQSDRGKTHFEGLSPNALMIQVRYHVATQSSDTFRLYQEEINYEILKILKKNQVDLAMPVSKVLVNV